MQLNHIRATLCEIAAVLTIVCGALYFALAVLLAARYIAHWRSRRHLLLHRSMLLLLGFCAYAVSRSITLVYGGIRQTVSNVSLILPTAFYLLLLALLIRQWTVYVVVLHGALCGLSDLSFAQQWCPLQQQRAPSHPVHHLPKVHPESFHQGSSSSSGTVDSVGGAVAEGDDTDNSSSSNNDAPLIAAPWWTPLRWSAVTVVVAVTCAGLLLFFGTMCASGSTDLVERLGGPEHCNDTSSVADIAACMWCGLHLCRLARWMRRPDLTLLHDPDDTLKHTHRRLIWAAFIFGGYSIARALIIGLNVVCGYQVGIDNREEQWLLPSFYFVEIAFLLVCFRLISGEPPHHQSTTTTSGTLNAGEDHRRSSSQSEEGSPSTMSTLHSLTISFRSRE